MNTTTPFCQGNTSFETQNDTSSAVFGSGSANKVCTQNTTQLQSKIEATGAGMGMFGSNKSTVSGDSSASAIFGSYKTNKVFGSENAGSNSDNRRFESSQLSTDASISFGTNGSSFGKNGGAFGKSEGAFDTNSGAFGGNGGIFGTSAGFSSAHSSCFGSASFGTTNAFGGSKRENKGTQSKFVPTMGVMDPPCHTTPTKHICICAMEEYKAKSMEVSFQVKYFQIRINLLLKFVIESTFI